MDSEEIVGVQRNMKINIMYVLLKLVITIANIYIDFILSQA